MRLFVAVRAFGMIAALSVIAGCASPASSWSNPDSRDRLFIGDGVFPPQGGGGGGGGGGGAGMGTSTSHTGDATLSTSGYNDNTGASGTVTLTSDATAAREFTVKRTASFELRLAPASGQTITWSGGTMAADEYLRLLSDGAVVHAMVDSAGDVQIISEFGALAEETP